MKREISVQPDQIERFSWNGFLYSDDTADPKVQRMKKIMHIAIENELTPRQHECITLRYLENLSVKEIAQQMELKPTTVYKHIHKAIDVLKKCSLYL